MDAMRSVFLIGQERRLSGDQYLLCASFLFSMRLADSQFSLLGFSTKIETYREDDMCGAKDASVRDLDPLMNYY